MPEVWTREDLNKHLKKNGGKLSKPSGDKYKDSIEKVLHDLGVRYVKEYQFCVGRKFRFDFAIPGMKIGIEFEGIMSQKSRHTSVTGYSNDTIKYNEAAKQGWIVLRYTVITYANCMNDLKEVLTIKNK